MRYGRARDIACTCSYVWRENKRYRIRAVQMENLKGLLGIRMVDKIPNARVRVVRNDDGCGGKD